jgi:hypothetical protein
MISRQALDRVERVIGLVEPAVHVRVEVHVNRRQML